MIGKFKDKDGNRIEVEIKTIGSIYSGEIGDHIPSFNANDVDVDLTSLKYVTITDKSKQIFGSATFDYGYKFSGDTWTSIWPTGSGREGTMSLRYCYLKTNMLYKHEVVGYIPTFVRVRKAEYQYVLSRPNPYSSQVYCGPAGDTLIDATVKNSCVVAANIFDFFDDNHGLCVYIFDIKLGSNNKYVVDTKRLKQIPYSPVGPRTILFDRKDHEVSYDLGGDYEVELTYDPYNNYKAVPYYAEYIRNKTIDDTVTVDMQKFNMPNFYVDIDHPNVYPYYPETPFNPSLNSWNMFYPESLGIGPTYDELKTHMLIDAPINNIIKDGVLEEIRENEIAFAADPITIEENIEDLFSPIIKKSATIRLVTSKYLGKLLFSMSLNHRVTITKNDEVIFRGILQPNFYSQPFSNFLEEFEIQALDELSYLNELKFAHRAYSTDSGMTPEMYDIIKNNDCNVSFETLLGNMGLPIKGYYEYGNRLINVSEVWYDCSKQLTSSSLPENIFKELTISTEFLYGDDYDDCMSFETVFANMLKYLNLHAVIHNDILYLFDWESLKGTQIIWVSLTTGTKYNHRLPINQITTNKSAGNDTEISISEVYKQLSLTCNIEEAEVLIDSPMDEDTLSSVWPTKQFYCREYLLEHANDKNAMATLVQKQRVDDRTYKITDWYIQPLYSKSWYFNRTGVDKYQFDESGVPINATQLMRTAKNNYITPILLNVTKVENPTKREDNSIDYTASTNTELYIQINGNDYINTDIDRNYIRPNDADIDTTHAGPIMQYASNNKSAGASLTPIDNNTTNYIIFSGKFKLIPNTYYDWFNQWITSAGGTGYLDEEGLNMSRCWNNSWGNLKFKGNSMYARRFFDLKYSTDKPTFNSLMAQPNMLLNGMHLSATDKDYKGEFFKYNWTSSSQRDIDKIAKIPLLACELRIGNKRLIETNIDQYGNSTFKWVEVGKEPQEWDDDDKTYYTNKTFSLGINPKLGDFVIGTEFDIQNTITFDMNLGDEKGTAIPIKQSDKLSGPIVFNILGVYNLTWNDVIYRHRTWFRKRKWTDNFKELLPKLRAICITDFECKIFSDNARIDTIEEDKDLVYITGEDLYYESFGNKDDLEFDFITKLTSDECVEKGIKNTIIKNAVLNTDENIPIRSLFNAITHETAKAEEMYLDSYYREFWQPKMNMTATVKETGAIQWSHYRSKGLDKDFYIQNKTYNVLDNTYQVNLREI